MTINKIMQEITQNPLKNYFEEIDRLEKEDSKQNSKFVSWRKCEKTEKVALITKLGNQHEYENSKKENESTRSTSPEEAKLNKRQAIKTKMCRNMMLHGNCKYGEKCSFAHKEEDLQGNSSKPPNYKTKLC